MFRYRLVCLILFGILLSVTQADAAGVYTADPETRVMAEPAADAEVVAILDGSERLMVVDDRQGWLKVQTWRRSDRGFLDKIEGWIDADLTAEVGRQETLVAPGSGAPPSQPVEPEENPPILLAISGTPALRFTGSCLLVEGNDTPRQRSLRGSVPKSYQFGGDALSCQFDKEDIRGRLRADLFVDDVSAAWAQTRAAFGSVSVRTAGPWGRAVGVEGFRQAIIRKKEPSNREPANPAQIVPPLSGPMIPPIVTQ